MALVDKKKKDESLKASIGEQLALKAGKTPDTIEGSEVEPAEAPVSASPKGGSNGQEEESKKSKEVIAKALIGLVPAIAGYALGGASGGQAGAQAGLAGLQQIRDSEDKEKKDQKEKSELTLKEKKESREQSRLDKEIGIKEAQLDIERMKLDREKPGKALAAEQADRLSGNKSALSMLSDLRSSLSANQSATGPIMGRLAKLNPYNATSKGLDAQSKITAQVIGKALEGGKLTDQDITRYREMLPNTTDSPDVASQKLDILERMIQQKQGSDVDVLGRAGYNVGNMQSPSEIKELSLSKPKGGKDSIPGPSAAQAAAPKKSTKEMSDEELMAELGIK